VVLTNPQIGNYGANQADSESGGPYIEGLIVREISSVVSNWRSEQKAENFLAEAGIPVLTDIDTRRLVRLLRDHGALRGVIAVGERNVQELVETARKSPKMAGQDLVSRVSTTSNYEWTQGVDPVSSSDKVAARGEERFQVVAYDYGIKRNILRHLVQLGSRVMVVPSTATAEEVLALKPMACFFRTGRAIRSRWNIKRRR
jgi:carbamoyl-phosphate synthase small subunit